MLQKDKLATAAGLDLGYSEWVTVTQAQIDAFADLTEDWQPIHLDPSAAKAAGYTATVAHGFLTLSMLSKMIYDVLPGVEGESASINYGFDKVRFIAPVHAGDKMRARFSIAETQPRGPDWMLRIDVAVEIENRERPALIADWLCLYTF